MKGTLRTLALAGVAGPVLFWTVVVVLVLTFGVFLATFETTWAGLGQRLYIGALTGWVAYHSFGLYRLVAVNGRTP